MFSFVYYRILKPFFFLAGIGLLLYGAFLAQKAIREKYAPQITDLRSVVQEADQKGKPDENPDSPPNPQEIEHLSVLSQQVQDAYKESQNAVSEMSGNASNTAPSPSP